MATMDDQIKVFFSYSISKAFKPDLTKVVLEEVKKEIASRKKVGWEIVDAMEQSIDGICKKVDESLARSNALIAECTTSSPNVMFEIGYARAMRYPMVILINSEAFKDPELKDYFEFLGLHPDRPLPADLGDIEFLLYSQDITLDGGKEEFKNRLRNSLDLIKKALPPGIQILHEGRKKLDSRISVLNKENRDSYDPPLLRLLGGWLFQITGELDIAENSGFLISVPLLAAT